MFKIVRSRVYAETVQALINAKSELDRVTKRSIVRSSEFKSISIKNQELSEKNEHLSARMSILRQNVDGLRKQDARSRSVIDELKTKNKMLNRSLEQQSNLVAGHEAKTQRLENELKIAKSLAAKVEVPAPVEEIPNTMKAVEIQDLETVQKPKRKYFRSGKFKKQK